MPPVSPALGVPPVFPVVVAPPVFSPLELPATSDVVLRVELPPFDVLPAALPEPPALNTRLVLPASQPPRAMAKAEPLTTRLKTLIVRVDIFDGDKAQSVPRRKMFKIGCFYSCSMCAHGARTRSAHAIENWRVVLCEMGMVKRRTARLDKVTPVSRAADVRSGLLPRDAR